MIGITHAEVNAFVVSVPVSRSVDAAAVTVSVPLPEIGPPVNKPALFTWVTVPALRVNVIKVIAVVPTVIVAELFIIQIVPRLVVPSSMRVNVPSTISADSSQSVARVSTQFVAPEPTFVTV
jgi:hypothetical protein